MLGIRDIFNSIEHFFLNKYFLPIKHLIKRNTFNERDHGLYSKTIRRFYNAMKLCLPRYFISFHRPVAVIFFEPDGTFKWKVIRANFRNILHIRYRSIDVVLVMIMKYEWTRYPAQNHNNTYQGTRARECEQ